MNLFNILFFLVGMESVSAAEPIISLEKFQQLLTGVKEISKDLAPARQADIGFIVEKSWVEKDDQGHFKTMAERICERRAKINVYDARNQQWTIPALIPIANCQTILDASDGTQQYEMTIDLGGLIYINNSPAGRGMKNFVPWAFPRANGNLNWAMQGFVMTPALDLQELAFPFGDQKQYFFKNQTITVTASFSDKGK